MDGKEKLKLERSPKSRHVAVIAIGGAIGTGLFLGSGTAIQGTDPSITLSYLAIGIISFFMVKALGELVLTEPDQHSFIESVKEYLGSRMEFVTGWIYWLRWLSLTIADLIVTGICLKYWFKDLPQWVGPLVIVVLLMLVNMVNTGLLGKLESRLSMIKVLAILALTVTGLIPLAMHSKIDSRTVLLSNLISYRGLFPTGSWGFLKSFQMAAFALVGIEIVGLAAGETVSPDEDIPKVVNTLPVRIGLLYIGSMIVVMVVYLWNKIVITANPFVQAFGAIGIPAATGISDFAVSTTAMSVTNSAIFSTNRPLYALSRGNNVPRRFRELSGKAIPDNALTLSSLILFIVAILNYIIPARIFDTISSVPTINFIMVWIIVMRMHLKHRAESKGKLGSLRMPRSPIISWVTVIFYLVILVILALVPVTRLSLLISIIFILALALSYIPLERRG